MTMPTHEFVSTQDAEGIWNQPNPETAGTNLTERHADGRQLDDPAGNHEAGNRCLPKLLHELINCLPVPAHIEALSLWFHSPKEPSVKWQLLMDGLSTKDRTRTELSLDDSIANWVWEHGCPLMITAGEETRFPDFVASLLKRGIKYFCAIPLMLADSRIGILGLASTCREALLRFDSTFMPRGLANLTSALKNAGLHQPSTEAHIDSKSEMIRPEQDDSIENEIEGIIGRSPVMRALCKQVKVVAPSECTVLILGETGTGKELIARAIHDLSPRRERPFIKINCAAIPAGLIESELFGHERGAFTGAVGRRIGRFEMANGGTLFLDEIGDIPLELQPKLLRVLQEQEFERVGSTQTIRVNVRIVTATSRELRSMVAAREFRPDLFYRLNVLPLHVPALRDRSEDIPLLVRHFLGLYSRKANKQISGIPVAAMEVLLRHHWPGNVRELQNVVERAVVLSPGRLLQLTLDELRQPPQTKETSGAGKNDDSTTLKDADREHIIRALAATNWIVGGPKGAAARLGLRRTTLIAKMQKLGISRLEA